MPDHGAPGAVRVTPLLDWSAYDAYGQGDAYADVPAHGGSFGKAAAVCIGNRLCQRANGEGRASVMCPSYRATGDTAHSTRERAALLRAALDGDLGADAFAGPELAAAMDLCVGCKGCKRECPNGVDMAALRTETLAQRWLHRRPGLRTRLFAGLPRWVAWLRAFAPVARWRNRSRLLARLGERLLGIAAQRSLPLPAARSFVDRQVAARRAPDSETVGRHEVVLWIDTFSNHFEPGNAHAALAVLEAAGYVVHIAQATKGRALCCGRTAYSAGFVEAARGEAMRVLDALAPHLAAGRPVIGLEPSCLLMFRDEYLSLGLPPEPVRALAASALLLEEFLAREHDAGRLTLPFAAMPAKALVHGHCHQKAVGAMKAMRRALKLVPQLEVEFVDAGCCGMAGSFGFEAEHHDVSLRMAEQGLLPAMRAAGADTWLLANGTSCRHQIADGAGRQARHFVHLLRAAVEERQS